MGMYATRYKWVNRYKTKRVCRRFWVTRYRTYCKWVLSSGGKKKTVSKCMRKWRCGVSGLNAPVSIAADGNVQCMSTNGKDCWWGKCRGKRVPRHRKLRPLVCGAMHKKKWGGNGYSSKGHWCNKVKGPVMMYCNPNHKRRITAARIARAKKLEKAAKARDKAADEKKKKKRAEKAMKKLIANKAKAKEVAKKDKIKAERNKKAFQ